MTNSTTYSEYKTLLVDDHELSRKLLSKQMEILGFEHMDYANNGQEALEKMDTEVYDIVLVDWAMPVMNGVEFIKKVREQDRFKKVALVMISAEVQVKSIQRAVEAGATSYITKPATQDSVRATIEKVADWIRNKKQG